MKIRESLATDRSGIESLYLRAFESDEAADIARLAVELLMMDGSSSCLSLVAFEAEKILGHIAFSPLAFPSGCRTKGVILSPLAVDPDFQGKGLGSRLVRRGLEILRARNNELVLVYGDPAYYGRFGFGAGVAEKFRPPYELKYPTGWQGLELRPLESGTELVSVTCVSALNRSELW